MNEKDLYAKDIKFQLSDVFDEKDNFDLIMISVFTARNDIYKINELFIDNQDAHFNFIFKFV